MATAHRFVMTEKGLMARATALLPLVMSGCLGFAAPATASSEFDAFMAQQAPDVEQEEQAFKQYQMELEQAFDAYQKAYRQEFEAYQKSIRQQWGEFLDAGPKTWISYVEDNQIRRVVDFERGTVAVSILRAEGASPEQVRARIDRAITQLLNSTEADAFASDTLSRRIEARLLDISSAVKTGQPSQHRLFAREDLAALSSRSSPYVKVSAQASSPVHWEITKTMSGEKEIVTANFVIPNSVQKKAERFSEEVTAAAVKERLPPELILAVIETESSFNPMARSHIPAYGLMQIVPRTAGRDATRYLYGESKILAPSYLYEIDKNIGVGSAYLHLLYYRYMRKIENPISRLYCVIAAYNTGASNVGVAFTGKKSFSGAVSTINSMTPQEVYQTLTTRLSYEETQKYLAKVTKRMKKYVRESS